MIVIKPDHPDYPRITHTKFEDFEIPYDGLTYEFIVLKGEEIMKKYVVKEWELKVRVGDFEFNPNELSFEFKAPETDEQYWKRVNYQEKEKARKAARQFTKEERERKQLAALKAKYEPVARHDHDV